MNVAARLFGILSEHLRVVMLGLVLFLLFCLCAPQLHAMDVHVQIALAGEPDESIAPYVHIVRDGIAASLERLGYTVLAPEEEPNPARFGRNRALLRYEYSLVGFLPRLHVIVTVRDLQAGTRVAGALQAARGNMTLYASLDDLLESLEPEVERYLARRSDPILNPWPVQLVEELLPPESDPEGSAVFVERISRQPLSGDFVLAVGETVPVTVFREGRYPWDTTVPLPGVRPRLPDPELRPRRRFGAQLHYSFPRLIGATLGGRYYPLPDTVFVGLELGVHLSGFFDRTPSQLWHVDPRLVAGYVPLGGQDRRLQPVFSTGFGVVNTVPSHGAPAYRDWYWNVINLGAEIGRGALRLYARTGFSYYFDNSRGIWEQGVNESVFKAPEAAVGTVYRW